MVTQVPPYSSQLELLSHNRGGRFRVPGPLDYVRHYLEDDVGEGAEHRGERRSIDVTALEKPSMELQGLFNAYFPEEGGWFFLANLEGDGDDLGQATESCFQKLEGLLSKCTFIWYIVYRYSIF